MDELENYTKEKKTIDLGWANVFAILLVIPIMIVFGLPYYLIWSDQFMMENLIKAFSNLSIDSPISVTVLIFGVIILGIVIHELIHGITWARYSKSGFKAIKFGVFWKLLTPYCHCKEPLKVNQYILGAMMPAIILGIIPSLAAFILGNLALLVFGMFFTLAAGGDFLIINLLRNERKDDLVLDHPSEAGCFIYRKIEQ
jgi:hypothetical protein